MVFQEKLNEYIENLNCTGKELAESSGLSAAVISRYRAGTRIPARDSEQLSKLAAGISAIVEGAGNTDMPTDAVLKELSSMLSGGDCDFDRMAQNLNALISVLDININELARAMNYDASYISRIRAGQRRPSDPNAFADGICRFVVRRRDKSSDKSVVAALIARPEADIAEEQAYFTALREWFTSGTADKPDQVSSFLEKLDEFDLNEYIRSIHFDELKVPTVPFQLPTSKNYYGVTQMRKGELDFFKSTVLSRSSEPVFMCSDMPMTDMAQDSEYPKKWMFGLAMMLKKGLHLNVVHNIDRPFPEMMLGLEAWIPLYMTSQVSPYYMKTAQNSVYNHFNYVSGAAALTGECVAGFHEQGKYYLTNKKDELEFYKKKSAALLKKAQPLMNIYRSESKELFYAFIRSEADETGPLRSVLCSPPLYTLPEDLLLRILNRNGVGGAEAQELTDYAAKERLRFHSIVEHSTVTDELHRLSEEEFQNYPVALSLTGVFYEKDIFYTYEEYIEHLERTAQLAETTPNYTFDANISRAFRNIQITMREGKWVMLSKNKSPTIHFVIRQPKLRSALENLAIPVVEQ